jgi:hypothetical protein
MCRTGLFFDQDYVFGWLIAEPAGGAQEAANTAWACASLGHWSPELLAAIEKRSDWLIGTGDAQNNANMAWACAKLGHLSPALFAKRSDWLIGYGNAQNVANMAWVCAKLGYSLPSLSQPLTNRVTGSYRPDSCLTSQLQPGPARNLVMCCRNCLRPLNSAAAG